MCTPSIKPPNKTLLFVNTRFLTHSLPKPHFIFPDSPIPRYKWQIIFSTHTNITGSVVVLPLDFLLSIVRFSSSYRYRSIDFGILQLQFNFLLPTMTGSIFFFLPFWQIDFGLLFLQNLILDFLNYCSSFPFLHFSTNQFGIKIAAFGICETVLARFNFGYLQLRFNFLFS